jgi:hypothetical protein
MFKSNRLEIMAYGNSDRLYGDGWLGRSSSIQGLK